MRTAIIVTDPLSMSNEEILKTKKAYEDNGWQVWRSSVETLIEASDEDAIVDPVDVIIFDLDRLSMKYEYPEELKCFLDLCKNAKFVCSTSFQFLNQFKDVGELYTSFDNLLDREFFAH